MFPLLGGLLAERGSTGGGAQFGDRGLPLDPRVGETSDEGSVERATMQLTCHQQPFTLEALGTITGGRTIVESAPTSAHWQSILVFGSEQDAADFMAQARGKAEECHAAGTTPAEPVDAVAGGWDTRGSSAKAEGSTPSPSITM